MGVPAYIVTNLAAAAGSSLTSSSEDSSYPLSNLKDSPPILANPFKFTSGAGGWIEIDFGASKSFDTVIVHGHNLNAAVSGNVKAGASASPSTVVGSVVYREKDLWIDVGSQSARYVRVTLTDAGSSATRVGELVIGTRVALPRSWRYGGLTEGIEDGDVDAETYMGVRWVYSLFHREKLELGFRLTQTELDEFRTLHEAVNGVATPFSFIEDVAGTAVYYVRKEPGFRPDELSNPVVDSGATKDAYDYNLILTEESRGADVAA